MFHIKEFICNLKDVTPKFSDYVNHMKMYKKTSNQPANAENQPEFEHLKSLSSSQYFEPTDSFNPIWSSPPIDVWSPRVTQMIPKPGYHATGFRPKNQYQEQDSRFSNVRYDQHPVKYFLSDEKHANSAVSGQYHEEKEYARHIDYEKEINFIADIVNRVFEKKVKNERTKYFLINKLKKLIQYWESVTFDY